MCLTEGKGVAFVLGGLNLRTRDYARFGQMFAQGGMYGGQQVTPADWVARPPPLAPQSMLRNPVQIPMVAGGRRQAGRILCTRYLWPIHLYRHAQQRGDRRKTPSIEISRKSALSHDTSQCSARFLQNFVNDSGTPQQHRHRESPLTHPLW